MYSKRLIEAGRWVIIALTLAGIVILYRHFIGANHTTVALTLLLFVLVLAGNWGLRFAVGASIAAAALYNYFFLPPVGTFTIADTQNWVTLFAFLGTAIYAAHLASRIREESEEANARRVESEMLYRLGRQLLQPENVAQLFNFIPSSVANAFNSPAVTLYIAEGDRIYLSDPKYISSPNIPWCGADTPGEPAPVRGPYADRNRSEIVRDLREAMMMPIFRPSSDGCPTAIPLRIGVRPSGALLLEDTEISRETMEALSGLISMSIERAEALETSARSEAAKETERLRTALLDSVTHELRTPAHLHQGLHHRAALAGCPRPRLAQGTAHRHRRGVRPPQPPHRAGRRDGAARRQQSPPGDEAARRRHAHRRRRRRGPLSIYPGREFRISVSSSLPPALADSGWILKVLANLLGNAAKYSPQVSRDQPSPSSSRPTSRATCSPSPLAIAAPASTRWSRA